MEGKICLCPESIRWIKKHLLKSAKAKFSKMIKVGSIKKLKAKKTKQGGYSTRFIKSRKYYLTKSGQPYIKLPNGRAFFISKNLLTGMQKGRK